MSGLHLAVVGDAILDRDLDGTAERLSPDAPVPVVKDVTVAARPGGAALAALLLRRSGHDVTLVTASGHDRAASMLDDLLTRAGVEVCADVRRRRTPVKTRLRANGRVVARIDVEDDGELDESAAPPERLDALVHEVDGVLVSDYGAGVTALDGVRRFLGAAARARPVIWDPHPAGAEPVTGTRLATPNRAEASVAHPVVTLDDAAVAASRLCARWGVPMVAVTLGEQGAVLVGASDQPFVVPAPVRATGDPCGAGDQFAGCLTAELAGGAITTAAVVEAVRSAAHFLARGGVAQLARAAPPADEGPVAAARRVRAEGGTVVATSGCFDLLHAGHVASLEAARALGDHLVVCLNSDVSVRSLKGPGRPLVPEADRRRVLASLACVDGVLCFDEATPVRALEALRPHVFVKGGDYGGRALPEEDVLRRWGGHAVIVPYLDGRSTTSLVEEVRRGAR